MGDRTDLKMVGLQDELVEAVAALRQARHRCAL
jgi:hypothetical protein